MKDEDLKGQTRNVDLLLAFCFLFFGLNVKLTQNPSRVHIVTVYIQSTISPAVSVFFFAQPVLVTLYFFISLSFSFLHQSLIFTLYHRVAIYHPSISFFIVV